MGARGCQDFQRYVLLWRSPLPNIWCLVSIICVASLLIAIFSALIVAAPVSIRKPFEEIENKYDYKWNHMKRLKESLAQ
jgi:hypothetical protein